MTEGIKSSLEKVTLIVSVTLITITAICSLAYYSIKDRQMMAENLESAIAKGVDPLAVRCSYVSGSDNVCVAYSITHGSIPYQGSTSSASKK